MVVNTCQVKAERDQNKRKWINNSFKHFLRTAGESAAEVEPKWQAEPGRKLPSESNSGPENTDKLSQHDSRALARCKLKMSEKLMPNVQHSELNTKIPYRGELRNVSLKKETAKLEISTRQNWIYEMESPSWVGCHNICTLGFRDLTLSILKLCQVGWGWSAVSHFHSSVVEGYSDGWPRISGAQSEWPVESWSRQTKTPDLPRLELLCLATT